MTNGGFSAMEEGTPGKRNWHVAKWPPLAWLETAIKGGAILIGIIALAQAVGQGVFQWPTGRQLAQFIVLAVLSLGLVAAVFDRLQERELVAMIFVLFNNLGHWGMVVALAFVPGPGPLLAAFAGLMLLGDLVKLVFLRVHDFRVRNTPPAVMVGLTVFYLVGYAVILAMQVVGRA